MRYRVSWVTMVLCITLLFSGVAAAVPSASHANMPRLQAASPTTPFEWQGITYNTVIVVDTVEDNDNVSRSEACDDVAEDAEDSRCTLRRAVVQANSTPSNERPVLIAFDLPAAEANNPDNPTYWNMQVTGDVANSPLGGARGTNGQLVGGDMTLDGATQGNLPGATGPQGRSDGPPIFVPDTPQFEGMVITGDNNIIRNMGWQGLRLIFNNSDNIVEQNWLGLSNDGNEVYFIDGDPRKDNNATLEEAESSRNNIFRNNVITGGRTNAITKRGNEGIVRNNLIGTRADGSVPEIDANRKCWANAQFYNWFGGGGLMISGADNTVEENNIAGLLYSSGDPLTTPDNAITLEDGGNIVRNNQIGIDGQGNEVGTCGRGIVLTDEGNRVENNTIVSALLEGGIGIRGSDAALGANRITANIIRGDTPQSIYIFPRVSNEYEYFNPAKVTSISGTTVQGESGDPGMPSGLPPIDSTCESCIIEIFLDDTDAFSESLQYLGTTTADASGAWSFTLDAPLQDGQYLRTTSTTVQNNQIEGWAANTTTKTSDYAYGPDGLLEPDPLPAPPALMEPPSFEGLLPEFQAAPETPTPTYNETVTVDTTEDYNNSRSETCSSEAEEPTENGCTLRRAIIEAGQADGPALVQFNIPESDPNYDAANGVWVIEMISLPGSGELEVRNDTTVDGFTQPGGRDDADGPNIFIRGSNNFEGLTIRGDDVIVRGLGFQRAEIDIAGGTNTFIEDNWVGLTVDGNGIYFINDNVTSEPFSTIESFVGSNVIRNNVVTGARDRSIAIRGGNSWIVGNYVGTRADGTVPPPPEGTDRCNASPGSGNWFGGAGILVSQGRNFQVYDNVIGGVFIASGGGAVQPPAIETQSSFSVIRNNTIGRGADNSVGNICGDGIRADGNLNLFEGNYIEGTLNGFLTAGLPNEYRGNILINTITPTNFTEVLATFRNYNPARIFTIDGTSVTGGNGAIFIDPVTGIVYDPTCPYCIVELFADDGNEFPDTRESLAVVTADSEGRWTATLSRPLAADEVLRTMTTTGDYQSIRRVLVEVTFTTKLSNAGYDAENLADPGDPFDDVGIDPPVTGDGNLYLPLVIR